MPSGITLEKLNIVISGNSKQATDSVYSLTKALADLKTIAAGVAREGGEAAKAIQSIGKSAGIISKGFDQAAASSRSAARDISGVTQAEKNLTSASKDTKSAAESVNKALGNTSGAKKSKSDIDKASKSVKEHTSLLKKLTSTSIGRIAMYRLIRSAIKEVTQAVSEGAEALLEWDRNYQQDVAGIKRIAASVDEMKSKWKETGGAVAAVGLTILQSLEPAISWLLNALTNIANVAQQIIRGLRGETKWYHMVYKEAKATTGQAKELQRVLFGFDELNVLPSKTGGSSGTTGGWSNAIEDIDEGILGVTSKIHDLVESIGGWKNVLIGGLGLLGLIKLLTKLLGGKNKALGDENRELQTDTANAYAFSSALSTAGAGAGAFASALGLIPLLDLGQQKGEILDYANLIQGLDLDITPSVDAASALQAGIQAAKYAQGGAALTPVQILSVMSSMGLGEQVTSLLTSIQTILSENPEKIPVTLFTDLLGAELADLLNALQGYIGNGLTVPVRTVYTNESNYSPTPYVAQDPVPETKKKTQYQAYRDLVNSGQIQLSSSAAISGYTAAQATGAKKKADSIASQLAMDTMTNTNPYWNMSATDLVNYAESTGLKLTAADKKALGYAIAGVGTAALGPIAASALGGLSGISVGLASLLESLGLIGAYAGGGTPDMGTLFYAGEKGPEIVSRMGNNQSGVMNIYQMQSAMEGANAGVINALYAVAGQMQRAIAEKSMDVILDGQSIAKNTTRYQNSAARMYGTPQTV